MIVTGIIAVASLSPQVPAVATGISDKVDHLAAYACLGFLLTLDWSRRTSGPVIMAAGAATGAMLELLQALVPGRQPDWGDVAVNTMGVLAGWLLASVLRRMARRGAWPDLSRRAGP